MQVRDAIEDYRYALLHHSPAKTRLLFMLYRIPRGYWPDDLDYEMCLYYTIHYIRKTGEKHDLFLQWKAEAEAAHGQKFRISTAIRPKVA